MSTALSHWVKYDFNIIESRPTESGRYLICRKDGKIHWETWNGSGWAYNHNEIRYWAKIVEPKLYNEISVHGEDDDNNEGCLFCSKLGPLSNGYHSIGCPSGIM